MGIKLSIIILSWNTKELSRECLESVVKELGRLGRIGGDEGPEGFEVIVVDNGSTDGSVEMVRKLIEKYSRSFVSGTGKLSKKEELRVPQIRDNSCNQTIKLIENRANLGFAKGNNVGIRQARGEYIMLLNSDTVIKEGAIEKLVEFAEGSGEVGGGGGVEKHKLIAVSPLLLLPSGESQTDYYMKFPNLWQIFLYHNSLLRPVVMKIPFLSSLIAQKSRNSPFAVDQLPGAALMAHRDVWAKVGLLDEDYHFLFEDVDWCWRAKKAGIKLMVVPEAKVIHIGGASWKKRLQGNSSGFYYQFFSSMLLFVRKNYSEVESKIFKWAIVLNFLLTLKFLLAWRFFQSDGKQKEFLK